MYIYIEYIFIYLQVSHSIAFFKYLYLDRMSQRRQETGWGRRQVLIIGRR